MDRKTRGQDKVLLMVLLVLAAVSCKQIFVADNPLAQVGDKVLYARDLPAVYSSNATAEDSVILLTNYVNNWVNKQLLLELAESNLSSRQKNVNEELEDYRATLLIHRYKQQYVGQKMDTLIAQELIDRFYEANKEQLILSQPIVRALFIKLPKDSPQLAKVKRLYASTKQDDLSELDKTCMQAALRYEYFDEQWIPLAELTKELPKQSNYEDQVKQHKRIEAYDDEGYVYLVAVHDYRPKGAIGPIEYETPRIKAALLHQRKQEMIDKLEEKIVSEAKRENRINIFIDGNKE